TQCCGLPRLRNGSTTMPSKRRGLCQSESEWIRLIAEMRDVMTRAETAEGAIAIAGAFDRFADSVSGLGARRQLPRVFVSHQRGDTVKAERIAWLATEVGFEYWLDIHDPA